MVRWVVAGDVCTVTFATFALADGSLLLKALAEPQVIRRVEKRLTGKRVATDTYSRRRRGLNTAVVYAMELGELSGNPLKAAGRTHEARQGEVDPRVVITHVQARDLLTALSYVGSWGRGRGRRLVAFFATLYYAGLRPAECIRLRETDCFLPAKGWGRLTLVQTLPVTSKRWTDHGERHERRGLEQRSAEAARIVPIPPSLVANLKAHLNEFGTADDGRLFRNERGGILGASLPTRAHGRRPASSRSRLPRSNPRSPAAPTTCDTRP